MFTIRKMPEEGMFGVYRNGQIVKAGTKENIKLFLEQTESKPAEFKNKFHCLSHCTECCQQQISVTEAEIFRIRRHLRKLEPEERQRLKDQKRDERFCPLLDVEKGLCSVYESRPELCKAFGHYNGALACSYNMDAELKSVEKHFVSMINKAESLVGQLGVDYTWDKGLIR